MRTLEDLKTDFLKAIKGSLEKACDDAYSELVNRFDLWAESDIEYNAQSHIMRDIQAMLGGEDPHWIKSNTVKYNISDFKKIRELIWKENADELTRSILESKNKEIEQLRELFNKALSDVRS